MWRRRNFSFYSFWFFSFCLFLITFEPCGYAACEEEIEPRRNSGFRSWGTDGRGRMGAPVSEGLLFPPVLKRARCAHSMTFTVSLISSASQSGCVATNALTIAPISLVYAEAVFLAKSRFPACHPRPPHHPHHPCPPFPPHPP